MIYHVIICLVFPVSSKVIFLKFESDYFISSKSGNLTLLARSSPNCNVTYKVLMILTPANLFSFIAFIAPSPYSCSSGKPPFAKTNRKAKPKKTLQLRPY